MRYPNLFLAGAPKCGTTSLAHWLAQHPAIFAPVAKEPLIFANDLTAARPHDPAARCAEAYARWGHEPWALDATTHYFFSAAAPAQIAAASPDARVWILLRNPVEAVHSMFHQLRFNGAEPLESLEQSLDAEAARAGHLEPIRHGYPENRIYSRVYGFSRNIPRFVEALGRDRVRVLLLDDLKADPAACVAGIFGELGLDPAPAAAIDYAPRNSAKKARLRWANTLAVYPPAWAGALTRPFLSREARLKVRQWIGKVNTAPARNPPLQPETRERLARQFRGEVEWLGDWLGRDLGHWLG